MTFTIQIPPGEIVTALVMDPEGWILKSTSYVVGLDGDDPSLPIQFKLGQNYPNPFNPTTTIPYSLAEQSRVKMTIVDISGREVVELLNDQQGSGYYELSWNSVTANGQSVAAGVYFCRLETDTQSEIQKLVLVR